jgi:hypothetical protein
MIEHMGLSENRAPIIYIYILKLQNFRVPFEQQTLAAPLLFDTSNIWELQDMLNAARGKDRPKPVVGLVVGHRWEN